MFQPLLLLSLAAGGLALLHPKPPPLKYLYTINITAGVEVDVGSTPAGHRAGFSYAGGNFSGPLLNGVLAVSGCLLASVF